MRRFELHRDEDATGVSGTGIVVEGVMFSDGSAAYRWMTKYSTICIAQEMEIIYQVHLHEGKTRVVWID